MTRMILSLANPVRLRYEHWRMIIFRKYGLGKWARFFIYERAFYALFAFTLLIGCATLLNFVMTGRGFEFEFEVNPYRNNHKAALHSLNMLDFALKEDKILLCDYHVNRARVLSQHRFFEAAMLEYGKLRELETPQSWHPNKKLMEIGKDFIAAKRIDEGIAFCERVMDDFPRGRTSKNMEILTEIYTSIGRTRPSESQTRIVRN